MKKKTFEIDKITDIADYVKNSLGDRTIIIIGERHDNKTGTDRKLQKHVMEVIKNLNPNYFLYELLHSAIYDPKYHKLTFRDDAEREEPENSDEFEKWKEGFYYNIAEEYKVKIIGCDLPSCTLNNLDLIHHNDRNVINPIREEKMGEIITECSENLKSSEPLIVVLGNDHVKETSKIYNFIKSGYISICIDDICQNCNEEVKDKDFDQCQNQNCKTIRTRTIKTISLE